MKRQNGFTVLELIIVIVFLAIAGTVFFIQKRDLEVAKRDSDRKTSINSIYYNLEDVFYVTNKTYPERLTAEGLKGLDPNMLKDPNGVAVGEEGSDYSYEPKDCTNGNCKSYVITANLEHEADYIKESRNK